MKLTDRTGRRCRLLLAISLFCVICVPASAQDSPPDLTAWIPHKAAPPAYPTMGLRPTPPDDLRRTARFAIRPMARGIRPSRLLLTEYLPPVADQGKQGSCVAWAAAYYSYTYAVAGQLHWTPEQLQQPKFQFSPAYLYNLTGDADNGRSPGDVFQLLKDRGCATLAEMPYDASDWKRQPDTQADNVAALYKAREIAHFGVVGQIDVEELKTYLADTLHPVVAGVTLMRLFPRYAFPSGKVRADYVYDFPLSRAALLNAFNTLEKRGKITAKEHHAILLEIARSGHALTIIGYDEARKAFRIVNSWGPAWGDNGFLWISENYLKNWGMEAWGFVAGGPHVRGGLSAYVAVSPPAVP